jgi:hypothetical protein
MNEEQEYPEDFFSVSHGKQFFCLPILLEKTLATTILCADDDT